MTKYRDCDNCGDDSCFDECERCPGCENRYTLGCLCQEGEYDEDCRD